MLVMGVFAQPFSYYRHSVFQVRPTASSGPYNCDAVVERSLAHVDPGAKVEPAAAAGSDLLAAGGYTSPHTCASSRWTSVRAPAGIAGALRSGVGSTGPCHLEVVSVKIMITTSNQNDTADWQRA